MAQNHVVKISGDSKNYQSAVNQAKKSLEDFQKANLSTKAVMGQVTSALTKFVSAAALAKGAQEAFNKIIQGSQTTGDKFAECMAAAKTTVNNFFSSLSTGDFTSFNMGLRSIIDNAREAQQALDRLGNANISWSYFQGARTADFRDQMTIAKNTNLSMSDRQAAYGEMGNILNEMNGMVEGYTARAVEAMAREMTKATGIAWQNVSKADLEQILKLDLMSLSASDSEKERLNARYAEYAQKAEAIKRANSQYIKGTVDPRTGIQRPDRYIQTDEQRKATEDATRELAASYQDAILYNEVLVRQSDEWLKNLISLVQQADAARRSMGELNNTYRETGNALKPAGTSSTGYTTIQNPTTTAQDIKLPAASGVDLTKVVSAQELSKYLSMKHLPELNLQISQTADNANKAADALETMSTAMQGLNDAGRSLEDIGKALQDIGDSKALDVTGGIISGVGAAVQAYSQLSQAAATAAAMQAALETPTVMGKIAAVAAIASAFASAASQLKSIASYAEGGVIGGSNFTDGITARVSSGEMIINEADQKRLYDSIHSGSFGGGSAQPYLDCEKIFLGLNNYGRRTGRGEVVFARR